MYVYLIWNNEGLRKTHLASTTITIAMCTFTKDPCYYINGLRFEKLWVCIVMGLKKLNFDAELEGCIIRVPTYMLFSIHVYSQFCTLR